MLPHLNDQRSLIAFIAVLKIGKVVRLPNGFVCIEWKYLSTEKVKYLTSLPHFSTFPLLIEGRSHLFHE
ncbi:hypothetical protein [Nostoc sp.]|uniref:hypothetical protein n=1 Tax=Nostoc sp. TaxID=1180 RepID=UPI002FFA47C3